MNFKKIGESVARVALDRTMDGKNIGEIAESVAETALETVAQELNNPGENSPQETGAGADKASARENLITSIVSSVFGLILRLFK